MNEKSTMTRMNSRHAVQASRATPRGSLRAGTGRWLGAWIALAGLWVAPTSLRAQALRYPSAEYWSDPEHVKAFLATYGVLAPVEPPATADEEATLNSLLLQMRATPALAAQRLQAMIKPGSSARLDVALGNLFFELGRLDDAIRAYRRATAKEPNFQRAFKSLGIALCQTGQFNPAIESLAKAVSLGASDALTYGFLAYCYLNTGRILSAESAYRHALVFDPAALDWKLGLSRALMEQQKFTEAITILDEAIAARPEDATTWLTQANACIGAGDMKRAAADFEIVRRMGKAGADTLLALGDIYTNENIPDLALDAYLAALALKPDQPVRRLVRAGEILVQRGDLDPAAQLLGRVRQNNPGPLEARDESALLKLESRLEFARGHRTEGAALLEQLVARDPLDGEALLLLARHHRDSGESERAALCFERAAKDRAVEVEALLAHGQMRVREGRFREAIPLIERALALRPGENVARYLEQVRIAASLTTDP